MRVIKYACVCALVYNTYYLSMDIYIDIQIHRSVDRHVCRCMYMRASVPTSMFLQLDKIMEWVKLG